LLPQSNSQTEERALTTVSINSDLRYFIEKTPVDASGLEISLQAKLRGQKDPTIALHAANSVPIEQVVMVMNIARRNHFKVILATSPER
jgi:biopolymer transport protein ExbD